MVCAAINKKIYNLEETTTIKTESKSKIGLKGKKKKPMQTMHNEIISMKIRKVETRLWQ